MQPADICNLALTHVGTEAIITTLNDRTKEARICAQNYDQARRALLAKHIWKFAIQRAMLTLSATVPIPIDIEYANQYDVPDDYIRGVTFGSVDEKWVREGRSILVNNDGGSTGQVPLRYVYDIQDASLFDPLFIDALSYELGCRICYPLTQSDTRVSSMTAEFDKVIKKARHTDAIEQTGYKVEADFYDIARVGPAHYYGPGGPFVVDPGTS